MIESQPTTTPCLGCGADLDAGTRFCAECGVLAPDPGALSADLAAEQLIGPAPTMAWMPREQNDLALLAQPVAVPAETTATATAGAPRASRMARRSLIVKGLAVACVVAGVAVLGLNDVGTHQRLTRSQGAYATSQTQLQTARADLADTVTQLTGVQADLTSTQAVLTTSKTDLAAKEQELAGVRNNLSDAKNNLTMQSGQIETLKSCLAGVSTALNYLAYADYSAAGSALQAVKVSCNAAYALL